MRKQVEWRQKLHLKINLGIMLKLIFPPKCVSCHKPTSTYHRLCDNCWPEFEAMPSESCTICHAPTEGSQDLLCMNCLKTKPYYTSARAAFTYNFASKKIILGFKYGDKILHKKFMSEMIIAKHQALLEKADLICPIPLHKKRLRQRKYNQAALLSRTIAKNLNLPNIADLLIRTKNTPSQTNLPYKERIANIKNAFIINPKFINLIKKQNIVIIDDVLTTGATANECARILHKNGAAQTHIITFARTVAE